MHSIESLLARAVLLLSQEVDELKEENERLKSDKIHQEIVARSYPLSDPTPILGIFLPVPTSAGPKQPKIDVQKLLQEHEDKLDFIESQIQQLYAQTDDLNERLKKFETPEGHDKALYRFQAELNGIDARVAELERPEPEFEAK